MPVTHIDYDHATEDGARLASAITGLENSFTNLNRELDTLTRMINGDGSDPSHFVYMTKRYKFGDYDPTGGEPTVAQNTLAKSAYDELQSLLSKLNSNAQVTDVNAALLQAFAKFR